MKLVPWAITLRALDLSDTVTGLTLIHIIQGMSFTTLFCRNYYVNVPADLIKSAKIDGASFLQIFWRIVLPLSPPILIVTVIWQFTNIWNEYLYGITFSEGSHRPVTAALMAFSANIAQAREYGIESAAVLLAASADDPRLSVWRKIFSPRPHGRRGQVEEIQMSALTIDSLRVRFGAIDVLKGIDMADRERRVHRPRRTVGLRKVDASQRHRRASIVVDRAHRDRRARRHARGAGRPRYRHGVPELCALSRDVGKGQHYFRHGMPGRS